MAQIIGSPPKEYDQGFFNNMIGQINRSFQAIQQQPPQVTVGSGPPPSSGGASGDIYIDKTNKLLYGPKRSNGWGVGFNPFV